MKRESRTVDRSHQIESPSPRHLPLVDLLVDTRAELMEFAVASGLNGAVEICNAGHCAPLVISDGKTSAISATGLPLGMFCPAEYSSVKMQLSPGDRLLLYTDGLSEARNQQDVEYGNDRLQSILTESCRLPAERLVARLLEDVQAFAARLPMSDDLTVMAIEVVGH